MIRIDHDNCDLCGKCVDGCPYAALEKFEDKVIVNENCTMCGACQYLCPADCIALQEEGEGHKEPSSDEGVWVLGEILDEGLHPVTLELAGEGRQLADALGHRLTVIVLGSGLSKVITELSGYAVDDVICLEHHMLRHFNAEIYTKLLAREIRERKPSILLGGATASGRALLPRLAVRLETGLTADCTGLEIESGRLLQTRPAFGGNIYATIECASGRPQMATVRPRAMTALKPLDKKRVDQNISRPQVQMDSSSSRVELLESVEQLTRSVNLVEAEVIVSGGRGVKGPDGFELLAKVAASLGGVVGASRAAVDAGWVPYAMQVGQTGRTVQPRVYIAMGISGAVQHLVGMQTSECIVAVNTDPEAPIFAAADYGIVADAAQVAKEIVRTCAR